ncbi:NAD-dependent aldehyde dehydrogenase (plasmid) [Phaeobacter inhibens]|jgi:succinate-semialdehyde dehydrogenase/glutarate-semialdehyde dehydrogenase|uniref:NAD-dependent aldehyde dehydrogenase n=1 Tax=Phaeobacter inhibens TaxID=221822 RepID=A0ABN5GUQ5_9RHOB|nr:NAD-dependent succinate-semialdehyde dehydrogenase [Phaeobacter inhibens]AUQ52678.1 NAD-dependent aldehyde dehydrogenase [Phaeobacter inhibens]AUQ56879.1 NAD-dependent aldehyde dehydrogenase [Phaeobacter inhibens]AUQ68859.1 NAD-dependent aldehyde dehydrogenase [Phaeobacter inhibens]AUQ80896.1 NAD-dependent aldehyde dehydrogenase [Phaeobacter inhibens]AUQ97283.1 NAD-dependent aldehyde dehydrogenase [Phaeobacter inhibens]
MEYTDLYINGTWTKGTSGERFDVINPATEAVLASVASADIADADAALDAAEAAMKDWAARTPRQRSEVLRKAWELMTARLDEFAHLITLENGKARADAMGEATYAAEFFRWFAEEAVRADGMITHAPASGARIVVQHKPAGLAVLVTPWNYPAAMGTRKIAPALAAGCAVIIKPASETPLTMLALMPLLEEAGVPAGLVNVLPSRRTGALVDHMLHDPRVRVVSFTGSTGVGRKLLKGSADQVLKPAMELGGNAPVVVFEDADMDTAIEGTMLAKMRNLGEACTAANRIYVHEEIAEEFTKRLTERMSALKVGDGTDPSVDVGPLVNADTRDKVAEFVADAVAKGATVTCGGTTPNGPGFFYPPTVMTNVPENAACVRDEIFGPVAAIQTFTDQEDVIARANDTEYGLVAYVFSEDFKRALQVCEQLEYGMVGLNRGLVSDPAAPFGGVKQSGLGREGGHEGMLEFMETQYISASW